MKSQQPLKATSLAVLAVVLLTMSSVAQATTARPLGFDQIVDQSALVLEGTVVDLQVFHRGQKIERSETKKATRAPVSPAAAKSAEKREAQLSNKALKPTDESQIRAVGVEGGKMLFTQVTLRVDREVIGKSGELVTFVIAGGSDEEGTVVD